MKMVRAIVRPEKQHSVTEALERAGFVSLTKMDVYGRGRQRGLEVGAVHYDELPKVMLFLVVEDEAVDQVVEVIQTAAHTGNIGDGKVFVSPVEQAYTIRTGASGL